MFSPGSKTQRIKMQKSNTQMCIYKFTSGLPPTKCYIKTDSLIMSDYPHRHKELGMVCCSSIVSSSLRSMISTSSMYPSQDKTLTKARLCCEEVCQACFYSVWNISRSNMCSNLWQLLPVMHHLVTEYHLLVFSIDQCNSCA